MTAKSMAVDAANTTEMPEEPDRALAYLLGRVARGDADAYAQFYDRVAPAVYGLALRMLRDRSAAEEVVQEVLVEAWRSAARFDATKGTVMTWVLTFAHRRTVDRVRRDRSYADRQDRERALTGRPVDDDPGARVEVEESRARVRAALETLPPPQREALVLAYFGGQSYPEVAAQLGVPLGTVKTRIRQGMLRLRDRLEENR